MMGRSAYIRERREKLFDEQGGLCHWCKCQMVIDPESYARGGQLPRNTCTLDHLVHRMDPRRMYPAGGEKRYVAACLGCNEARGAADKRFFRSKKGK